MDSNSSSKSSSSNAVDPSAAGKSRRSKDREYKDNKSIPLDISDGENQNDPTTKDTEVGYFHDSSESQIDNNQNRNEMTLPLGENNALGNSRRMTLAEFGDDTEYVSRVEYDKLQEDVDKMKETLYNNEGNIPTNFHMKKNSNIGNVGLLDLIGRERNRGLRHDLFQLMDFVEILNKNVRMVNKSLYGDESTPDPTTSFLTDPDDNNRPVGLLELIDGTENDEGLRGNIRTVNKSLYGDESTPDPTTSFLTDPDANTPVGLIELGTEVRRLQDNNEKLRHDVGRQSISLYGDPNTPGDNNDVQITGDDNATLTGLVNLIGRRLNQGLRADVNKQSISLYGSVDTPNTADNIEMKDNDNNVIGLVKLIGNKNGDGLRADVNMNIRDITTTVDRLERSVYGNLTNDMKNNAADLVLDTVGMVGSVYGITDTTNRQNLIKIKNQIDTLTNSGGSLIKLNELENEAMKTLQYITNYINDIAGNSSFYFSDSVGDESVNAEIQRKNQLRDKFLKDKPTTSTVKISTDSGKSEGIYDPNIVK